MVAKVAWSRVYVLPPKVTLTAPVAVSTEIGRAIVVLLPAATPETAVLMSATMALTAVTALAGIVTPGPVPTEMVAVPSAFPTRVTPRVVVTVVVWALAKARADRARRRNFMALRLGSDD